MLKRFLVGHASSASVVSTQRQRPKRNKLSVEYLEPRRLLTWNMDDDGGGGGYPPPDPPYLDWGGPVVCTNTADAPAPVGSLTPNEVRNAYHINGITFGSVPGDGSDQTIAIVVAFNYSGLLSDTNQFSQAWGLPQFNQGGPSLTIVNENGGSWLPGG